MLERPPPKEIIGKGELFFLEHPGTDIFSGYGLTMQPGTKGFLVGLLMVDRPHPADPEWLNQVEAVFGEYQLVPMTTTGERGIVCQIQIEPESQTHLRQVAPDKSVAIQQALEPLLEAPPNPAFLLRWNEEKQFWQSQFIDPMALPQELHELFERTGHGCLATETNIGVVHICHAPDADIEGFARKPVWTQWQLILMPTAPLIRLALTVVDQPDDPYWFESFLNVAEPDQAQTLARLTSQEELYLAFYGDDLTHRFTKTIDHSPEQCQQLDELADEAIRYWNELPPEQRDFDLAKAEFMSRFV